ncbi:MAG TPA: ATP-binding protein [Planctomycetota bacterium]|nr:ATP-binding protein [Planctomycetota bacterium]
MPRKPIPPPQRRLVGSAVFVGSTLVVVGVVEGWLLFGDGRPGIAALAVAAPVAAAVAIVAGAKALAFRIARREERLGAKASEAEERESLSRETIDRLRALVETAVGHALYLLDADGRIERWNAGAERLHGLAEGDVSGEPWSRVFRIEDVDAGVPEVLLAEARRAGSATREVWHERPAGASPFRASIVVSAHRREDGELVGYGVATRDLSDRIELEERAHQAQRIEAVGRLAGGVAHDFNDLFTRISGYGELLRARVADSEPCRSYAREILDACVEAGRVTRKLLTFSTRPARAPRVLDLNDVVRHLHAVLRRVAGDDVQLELRLQPRAGLVKADPDEIEQMLLNLVANAREAMPHGGRLTIETSDAGAGELPGRACGAVVLSVTDTGVGMTDDVRARIFEPFFTTKPGRHASGLGLSAVYGMVTQSAGRIEVDSRPGGGSTFRVLLPRCDDAASSAPAAELDPPPCGSETILLVEDERGVRRLVRTMLAQAGYVVLDAPSGSRALAVADRHAGAIDLLLTDIGLPGMTGPELATELRKRRPESRALFMSGYTGEAIVLLGYVDSEPSVLFKPFEADELLRRVRDALAQAPVPAPRGGA